MDLLDAESRTAPQSLQQSLGLHSVNASVKKRAPGLSSADVESLLDVQMTTPPLSANNDKRILFAKAKHIKDESEDTFSSSPQNNNSSRSDASSSLVENVASKTGRVKVLWCLAPCIALVFASLVAVIAACLSGFCTKSAEKAFASSSGSPGNLSWITIPTMTLSGRDLQQGCCSWHGGVCGCSGGRTFCCDDTFSPSCTCGGYDDDDDYPIPQWTPYPTARPTRGPTGRPTPPPTPGPTGRPTPSPTPRPSASPTLRPTQVPTHCPTPGPTPAPTSSPTPEPTPGPTPSPTLKPTPSPTTEAPTPRPTGGPEFKGPNDAMKVVAILLLILLGPVAGWNIHYCWRQWSASKAGRAKVLWCLALCIFLVFTALVAVSAACLSGSCYTSPDEDSTSSAVSPDNLSPIPTPAIPLPITNFTSNPTPSEVEDGASVNSFSDEEQFPPGGGQAGNIFARGTNAPSSLSSDESCGGALCAESPVRPQTAHPSAQSPALVPTFAPPTIPIRPTMFPTQDTLSPSILVPKLLPPTLNPPIAPPTSVPTSVPPTVTPPKVAQPTWRPTNPPTVYPTMFPTTAAPSTVAPTSLQPTPRPTTAPPTSTPSSPPSMTPTAISSSFPLKDTGTTILLPNYTLVELELRESPQSKALAWLASNYSHAALGAMPEWRKQQLFAMATLYYSLSGNVLASSTSTSSRWLDPSISECLWPAKQTNYYGSYAWSNEAADWCSDSRRINYLNFGDQLNPNGQAITRGIPPEVELLPHVSSLDFLSTGFVGQLEDVVPTQLVHLAGRLTALNLGANSLSGTIPTFLAKLSNLRFLQLSQNLSGVIPTQLGLLTKLTYLSLSYNKLVGSIPAELGLLTNLGSSLFLNNNDLSGVVPREVCSASSGLRIDCLKVYCPTSPYSCSCNCP